MGRRPEGRRSTRAALVLALLPLLLGGRSASVPLLSAPGEPSAPGSVLWVFFTPDSWESPQTLESLARVSARVRYRSDWLRAVSVEVASDRIPEIMALPGVVEIRPVGRLPVTRHLPTPEADSTYGALWESLEALGIPQAHAMGFQGVGVRIGILDGTFMDGHATLNARPPMAMRDFVDLDASVYPDPVDSPNAASHGTALWSLISGNSPGLLRGGAPGVDILLARIRGFEEISQADEDRWVAGLEWLESQGARIVVSGVGFRDFQSDSYSIADLNGNGTVATRAADQAAQRGVLVVAPVGNGGPALQSLEAPADGDSVLAVGAVDSRSRAAAFSASGPTGDGRSKPDLFAPGLAIEAASAIGVQVLERVSGTEFAGALLAGALALAVEAHPDRGPMELVEMFKRSTSTGEGVVVGVPHTASAIVFPDGLIPLPLQEVDGEGEVTSLAPQFQWNAPSIYPLGLPVTFHLELAEDSLFQMVILSDPVVGTFARRPSAPLPPRSRLFWRVRGLSVQGVERTTSVEGPITVPSWVSLEVLNDPAGSELVDPQPEFQWRSPDLPAPAGPFIYELQIVSERESELIQAYSGLEDLSFRLPSPLPFNRPMRWRVIAQARSGVADTVTSAGPFVLTSGANPPVTILYQNFPNPFPNVEFGGMETRIWFDLAQTSTVELSVYDIRGRLVRQLIPGRGCEALEMEPGLYGREGSEGTDPCMSLSWNGLDDRGREVEGGVYLLRLRAGGVVDVRRVVFWP
jgi:hypothetical protein